MGKRFVFIYGFDKEHTLRDVKFMIDGDITVKNTFKMMNIITFRNPDVVEIYAMDGSWELSNSYKELIKNRSKDFTLEIAFHDYIKSTGLKLM